MVVVGLSGTGLSLHCLMQILWYNLSWVLRYSYNMVCYMVNFILWVVKSIGYTIEEFSNLSMPSQSTDDFVPMTVQAWLKGVTIIFAVLVVLLVMHYQGVSSTKFAEMQFRSWLPWPYFIRQSHVFYAHAACVGVVAFTACRAYAVAQAAVEMPIVYVQVYAFDTLLLVVWCGVEVLWAVLCGTERLVRKGHQKHRWFQCAIAHTTIQVAMTDDSMILVGKHVLQRMFIFDCTETVLTATSVQPELHDSMHMILEFLYPVLRVSGDEECHTAYKISEHDGFTFATAENKREQEAIVKEAAENDAKFLKAQLDRAELTRAYMSRTAPVVHVGSAAHVGIAPPAPAIEFRPPDVPFCQRVQNIAAANPFSAIVALLFAWTSVLAVVCAVVYQAQHPPKLSPAASAWQDGYVHLPEYLQSFLPRHIQVILEHLFVW